MRAFQQGSEVRVTVSAREVRQFERTWPCSGLDGRAIGFVFDSGGDLVEVYGADGYDGEDLLALSHEASNYAAKRLGRPELARGEVPSC